MSVYPPVDRIYVKYDDLDKPKNKDPYNKNTEEKYIVCEPHEANLVTSLTKEVNGPHAPVIDMDFPIEVYPSSQLGHHHLYINKLITFEQYKKLLLTLADIGLCEPGYVKAAIATGYSAVRPVGVVKPGQQPSAVKVLTENAKLRKQNYELKAQLEEARKKLVLIGDTKAKYISMNKADSYVSYLLKK